MLYLSRAMMVPHRNALRLLLDQFSYDVVGSSRLPEGVRYEMSSRVSCIQFNAAELKRTLASFH